MKLRITGTDRHLCQTDTVVNWLVKAKCCLHYHAKRNGQICFLESPLGIKRCVFVCAGGWRGGEQSNQRL